MDSNIDNSLMVCQLQTDIDKSVSIDNNNIDSLDIKKTSELDIHLRHSIKKRALSRANDHLNKNAEWGRSSWN